MYIYTYVVFCFITYSFLLYHIYIYIHMYTASYTRVLLGLDSCETYFEAPAKVVYQGFVDVHVVLVSFSSIVAERASCPTAEDLQLAKRQPKSGDHERQASEDESNMYFQVALRGQGCLWLPSSFACTA